MKNIVGIDEAGRGPLAGPVAVGIVTVPANFDWALLPGVGDSKEVSPKNRETIFRLAQKLKKNNVIDYVVIQKTALQIDKNGIAVVIRKAIADGLLKLHANPKKTLILLDGSLFAPDIYINQKTIIKGDSKEKVIGLASILAKVTRDRYMDAKAKKHPKYLFENHKGYGTVKHRALIKKHGPIYGLHRLSYLRNVLRRNI